MEAYQIVTVIIICIIFSLGTYALYSLTLKPVLPEKVFPIVIKPTSVLVIFSHMIVCISMLVFSGLILMGLLMDKIPVDIKSIALLLVLFALFVGCIIKVLKFFTYKIILMEDRVIFRDCLKPVEIMYSGIVSSPKVFEDIDWNICITFFVSNTQNGNTEKMMFKLSGFRYEEIEFVAGILKDKMKQSVYAG